MKPVPCPVAETPALRAWAFSYVRRSLGIVHGRRHWTGLGVLEVFDHLANRCAQEQTRAEQTPQRGR